MSDDLSRPVATTPDSDFTLSIDEALERYARAGIIRTPRSIQRYCALGHIQGHRVDTQFGEKWLITPESVDRHIAYIKEVTPPTSRDLSRPVATSRAPETKEKPNEELPPTRSDLSRPVATTDTKESPLVALLERENSFLREQVGVKDKQIAELSELYRGTHVLTQGLQRLLAPLIGASDPQRREAPDPRRQSTSDEPSLG